MIWIYSLVNYYKNKEKEEIMTVFECARKTIVKREQNIFQ